MKAVHLPLLIYREKSRTVEILDNKRIWLGTLDDIGHLTKTIKFKLEPGDSLLLYTDDITEAMYQSTPGIIFGQSNLIKTFKKNRILLITKTYRRNFTSQSKTLSEMITQAFLPLIEKILQNTQKIQRIIYIKVFTGSHSKYD